MAQPICPTCGARCDALTGHGRIELVRDEQVDGLVRLLGRELVAANCSICGVDLGVAPTVVCASAHPPAVDLLRGTRAAEAPVATLLSGLDLPSVVPLEHSEYRALVASVTGRIADRRQVLNDAALADIGGTLDQHLKEHWREFTGEAFVAALVSTQVPVAGTQIMTLTSGGGIEEHFGTLQARAWRHLAMSWASDEPHDDSLQADLDRYVLRSAVPTSAAASYDDLADQLQAADLPLELRYVIEAVRAAVHLRAGDANPEQEEWAEAVLWLEFGCSADPGIVRPLHALLRVSRDFARSTVPFAAAWKAIEAQLHGGVSVRDFAVLANVVEQLGYPDLAGRVVAAKRSPGVQKMLEEVDARRDSDAIDIGDALRIVRLMGAEAAAREEAEKLADGLIERFDGYDAQAAVEAWLGSVLKRRGAPAQLLARVGAEPRPWERGLEGSRRAALLTERSNALRLLGRSDEALSVARSALAALPPDANPDHRHVAELNVAILLRDTGAPDEALQLLQRLAGHGPIQRRISALSSLATTLALIRRVAEAKVAFEAALALADGPWSEEAPYLRGSLATLAAIDGDNELALAALVEADLAGLDVRAFLAHANAVLIMLAHGVVEIPDELVRAVAQRLLDISTHAAAGSAIGAARLLAWWHDLAGDQNAEARWVDAAAAAEDLGLPVAPEELLRLAAFAYDRDEPIRARELLAAVPPALARTFGAVSDLRAVAMGTDILRYSVDKLSTSVVDAAFERRTATWADVRWTADSRRGVVARARGASTGQVLDTWPDDDRISAALRPEHGRVGVVEWIGDEEAYYCFVTTVDAAGAVSSDRLKAPPLPLQTPAAMIPGLIRGWRRSRAGDPLDDPEWQELVAWWTEELDAHLAPSDHLVVVEHGAFAGLPWHAACGERWSCSYATGWAGLLHRKAARPPRRLGVVLVPKHGDAPEVMTALAASLDRTREFAASRGLVAATVVGAQGDVPAIVALLEQSDASKLLCHGFIDAADGEVALMVAVDGTLPLRQSIASGTPLGQRHRLSWSALRSLQHAPEVVFSIACSSGVAHPVGLGERLGLFAAFSATGTRAMVAPRWEVPAREVAPVLDETIERWIERGGGLAAALHSACVDASKRMPPRYAWALALEGDWL